MVGRGFRKDEEEEDSIRTGTLREIGDDVVVCPDGALMSVMFLLSKQLMLWC